MELYELLTQPSIFSTPARPFTELNSSADEHMLCLTADSKTIYFAGTNRKDGLGGDDVFESKFVNGKWSKPKVIESISSPRFTEVPLSVSADGKRLLIYEPDGNGKGIISYSDKTSKGWSKTKPFPASLNTSYFQSDAQMTPDGQGTVSYTHLTLPTIYSV